jgi:hypothetical protein
MNEYERLHIANFLALCSLRKEASVSSVLTALALAERNKKTRKKIKEDVIRSRPYFDVETGRFL